jgi:hypothetical protein
MVEVVKDLGLHLTVQFSFLFFFTSFVPDSRASERAERMDGRENPD